MRWRILMVPFVVLHAGISLAASGTPEGTPGANLWAIELGAADLDRSVRFYTESLGFHVERRGAGEAVLRNGRGRLILSASDAPAAPMDMARVYLNMSVGELRSTADRAVSMGGRLVDPEPGTSPVGSVLEITDPSGHPIHLIDHPSDEMAAGDPPAIFNYGVNVPSIEEDERFLRGLGFEVHTRDYLPDTLVFKRGGIGYIVVHPHADRGTSPGWSSGALILAGRSPGAAAVRGPSGILIKTVEAD